MRPTRAFTLIELLTVISIIAVLMSILIPVIETAKESARQTQAKNTSLQIVAALKAYYQDYNRFPPVAEDPSTADDNASQDTVVGDPNTSARYTNNTIFNTLRGIDAPPNTGNRNNRRGTVYFNYKTAANTSGNLPRNGFYDRDGNGAMPAPDKAGCLFDPWGRQYNVIMDTNFDNRIDLGGYYADYSGATSDGLAPRDTVGVFSMGKDEQLGTKGDRVFKKGSQKSDDVISW